MVTRILFIALILGLHGSIATAVSDGQSKALRLIALQSEEIEADCASEREVDALIQASNVASVNEFFNQMGCEACQDELTMPEMEAAVDEIVLEFEETDGAESVYSLEYSGQLETGVFAEQLMSWSLQQPEPVELEEEEPEESTSIVFTADEERFLLAQEEPQTLLQQEFEEYQALQEDLTRVVSDDKYRLQIGDQLIISIYGEAGTSREVAVDALGNVSYLLVGTLKAFGKTVDELRGELNERIKKIFKHAIVTVTPSGFGGQFYTILGEVLAPGRKVLSGQVTVLSAMAGAGGLRTGGFRAQTIELADLSHAFLARDGDYVPVDFARLVFEGDMTQDLPLRNGDYIYIPSTLSREIHVLGQVISPTTIGYTNVVTLAEAICQARGLIEDQASSRVLIIRGSLVDPIRIEADIKRILKGEEKDVLLQPGDIVYVPTRRFQSMREWVRAGVRAFVSAVASSAGGRTYVHFHQHAGGAGGVIPAVTVIP